MSNLGLIDRPIDRPVVTTGAESRAERRLELRASLRHAAGKLDLILSVAVVVVFIVLSFFPTIATSLNPILADPRASFQAPSAAHWFGTDELGRDLWSRVVHGASLSLSAACYAVLLSFVIGTVLGVVAGTTGGWIDALIMRIFDAVLAIPGLLMVFAILAVLGNGVMNIALAIGIAGSVSFGRVMRSEVMSVRSSTYVEAASALGVRPFGVVTRHIIPNAITPLISLAALEFGTAMLTIGAMGYLGFGAEPPLAEWGALIADGQKFIRTSWWLGVLPGIVFVIVVLAVNRIARVVGQGGNTNA